MAEFAERIQKKLVAALNPSVLEIRDESARHAGHAGARPEGETHFRVKIVSDAFRGKSRVERHRVVHQVLADELAERVHALALQIRTPEEEFGAE